MSSRFKSCQDSYYFQGKDQVLVLKLFLVWFPACLPVLSLFIMTCFHCPIKPDYIIFCVLKVPYSPTLPSYWSCDTLCLEQTLIWLIFSSLKCHSIYPYVFAMTLYHRLSFRVHILCIVCEFMTFLSLAE